MTLRSSRRKLKAKTKPPTPPAQTIGRRNGVIDHKSAGTGLAGGDVWFVTVDNDTFPATHYAHYTPTVGDVVAVELVDGSPHIAGQVIGQSIF